MGIFKNIFKSKEPNEEKVLPWIAFNALDQLNQIQKNSISKTQIIFKHSTRCGISRMVLNQFAKNYPLTENEADIYYLDILNYRELSNEVGYKFQVIHQSPQLLVIKNGVVVTHESHGAVNSVDIQKFI